jgi:predicted RNA-binding Zn-ribbon protein involved in translation (DUF1610 family)
MTNDKVGKDRPMPISFSCPNCGKKLKAPDSAVGKSSKCPQCGSPVTCPEPVYDAELVETPAAMPGGVDPYGDLDSDKPYGMAESAPAAAMATEARRPCPMCGEMIVATAAKCRFCGEVFDDTIKKVKKSGKKGKKQELRFIAVTQRYMIIFMLIYLVGILGYVFAPAGVKPFFQFGGGLALLVAVVFAFIVGIKVYGYVGGILLAIPTIIPCLGLLFFGLINSRATGRLRENGFTVGFLGADMSEF